MKPAIGIQLYTFRDHIQTPEDFDSTLARLEKMEVETVQISGIGKIPAEKQKEILEKHKMQVCITHKPFDNFTENILHVIESHRIIDCNAPGLGSAPEEYRGSNGRVRKFLDAVTVFLPELKKAGMTFNYHNHNFEFHRLDDRNCTMMDILLNETDPEFFHFIPDVAWIDYAEQDVPQVLKKMKGRIKVIHFKDYLFDSKGYRKFVSPGKGVVDLRKCYETACELEIPYIMYEQDCDWKNGDPFESVEEAWEYLCEIQK